MLLYSLPELLLVVMAAMVIDWLIGDPRQLPHPVVMIGKWITFLESKLYKAETNLKRRGVLLVVFTIIPTVLLTFFAVFIGHLIHAWVGYAVQAWLISTTIAMKGLKQAARNVYIPLMQGDLQTARQKVGEIVGRSTDQMDESEVTRATVETVAENTVDAVVSPLFYALIGGAPLAMLYRAANTLDSMAGYKNERYIDFGWASARWDDVLNWMPARLTGWLLAAACWGDKSLSSKRALRSIRTFAHLHPSPNSGIPESAVAGALGIQLGGRNMYGNVVSDRAVMGWPLQEKRPIHIIRTNQLMFRAGYILFGGMLCAYFIALFNQSF